MSEVDELAKVLGGMKQYIDGQVGAMREEFAAALEAHVHAINELQGVVAGLMTEQTLSAAFAGEDYRRFVVSEAAAMGVKPSEIIAAKKEMQVEPAEPFPQSYTAPPNPDITVTLDDSADRSD